MFTVSPSVVEEKSVGQVENHITLAQYILNPNHSVIFNTSNVTFDFLPGEHELDGLAETQLIVVGVSNIVWRGSSTERTVLSCKQEYTFYFS